RVRRVGRGRGRGGPGFQGTDRPARDAGEECGGAQLASSLGYLTNQRQRMKYPEHRKQGLPLTSSTMESTVKQIIRRIKGSEKFWSEGVDPMLHLVADRLSQTNVTEKFWLRRVERIIESARYPCYQQAC